MSRSNQDEFKNETNAIQLSECCRHDGECWLPCTYLSGWALPRPSSLACYVVGSTRVLCMARTSARCQPPPTEPWWRTDIRLGRKGNDHHMTRLIYLVLPQGLFMSSLSGSRIACCGLLCMRKNWRKFSSQQDALFTHQLLTKQLLRSIKYSDTVHTGSDILTEFHSRSTLEIQH